MKSVQDRPSLRLKALPAEARRRAYLEALGVDVWALRRSAAEEHPQVTGDVPPPESQLPAWPELRDKVAAGATVIMTTHILEVAERMAERIGIIDKGRMVAEGTLEELRRQAGRSGSSLEDIFLDLVAEQDPAA